MDIIGVVSTGTAGGFATVGVGKGDWVTVGLGEDGVGKVGELTTGKVTGEDGQGDV